MTPNCATFAKSSGVLPKGLENHHGSGYKLGTAVTNTELPQRPFDASARPTISYAELRREIEVERGTLDRGALVVVASLTPPECLPVYSELMLSNMVSGSVRYVFLFPLDGAVSAARVLAQLVRGISNVKGEQREQMLDAIKKHLCIAFGHWREIDPVYVVNAESPHSARVYYCLDQYEVAICVKERTLAAEHARQLLANGPNQSAGLIWAIDGNTMTKIEAARAAATRLLDESSLALLERLLIGAIPRKRANSDLRESKRGIKRK